MIVTPPPSPRDSKPSPVAAHLVPLPDSRPPTPDLRDSPPNTLPDQSPSSTLLPQETGIKGKGTLNTVRDSEKKAEQVSFAFSFSPNTRPIIEPCSWSRPPQFSVQAGEAVVNERIRKAFCAAIRCPLVPLRSHTIPTPASFGESTESLEVRRAELKRAGYRLTQIHSLV